MKVSSLLLAAAFVTAGAGIGFSAAIAQEPAPVAAAAAELPSGTFVRKSKRLEGNWQVIQRDGQTVIRFADDFRAANGPDLKIFLSPKDVATVTGTTAVEGSLLLGELKSTRGTQEYLVPAGVNLDDYASVLVHCEEFAVLWGGGDL